MTKLRSNALIVIANILHKASMKQLLENRVNACKTFVLELELMTSKS